MIVKAPAILDAIGSDHDDLRSSTDKIDLPRCAQLMMRVCVVASDSSFVMDFLGKELCMMNDALGRDDADARSPTQPILPVVLRPPMAMPTYQDPPQLIDMCGDMPTQPGLQRPNRSS